jgi:aryl-alcohol dehydrogenase-like predicted oxidoreductase
MKNIGLGTFPFSSVFTKVDKVEAQKIVFKFLDLGGKYIESALIYDGVNELLANILHSVNRDSYYLSTKCVTTIDSTGKKIRTGKYESIITQCDKQLKDLKIDYLDLLMIHFPPTDVTFDETMIALIDLQRSGKIKDIGVSNVNIEQLKEFNKGGNIKFVQNRFSLINRQNHSSEMNNYCSLNNIKYIPYQVIERGQLTTNPRQRNEMSNNDLRINKPEFNPAIELTILEWVKNNLIPIAQKQNITVEAMSIWWLLQQPNIELCAVGATNVSQLESNMLAYKLELSMNVLTQIETAYKLLKHKIMNTYNKSVTEFRGV